VIVILECQTRNDTAMDERLLHYTVTTKLEQKKPVLACVIYLLRDGQKPTSPLVWDIPNGYEVLRFRFLSIEIGKLTPQDILSKDIALWPFLPLTQGGEQRKIITGMLEELKCNDNEALIPLALTFATLAYRNSLDDLDWLKRRMSMLGDIIRESPFYQWILEEGMEKGVEQGFESALQTLVHVRFPQLSPLAEERVPLLRKPELLNDLIAKIGTAQTVEEAEQFLLSCKPEPKRKTSRRRKNASSTQ